MISPSQCRAARALLGWSQDDLEAAAKVSKKTIADFERNQRSQHDRTTEAVEAALVAQGIIFIPQNGGGEGVRRRASMPRLFRREDVQHRNWVAFAFDYKQNRVTGFINYDALASIALDNLSPTAVFDRDASRILMYAAEKVDKNEFDPEGRVLIRRGDLPPIEFDPKLGFDKKSRVGLHLICRKPFISASGVPIDSVDYNGFRISTLTGQSKTFLKLVAGDGDHDAIDVTAAAIGGAFIISERAAPLLNVGDKVRLVRGQQRPEITGGEVGTVSEIEEYPILMGPVPRIRVRFGDRETAWEMPNQFERATSRG